MEWPQDFEAIRTKAEARLGRRLEQLNRSARRRLLEAVDQFGSVEAIPQAVWDDIEREAFALLLPIFAAIAAQSAAVVLDSWRDSTPPTLIDAAVDQRSRDSAKAVATAAVDGLRKGVQRRYLRNLEVGTALRRAIPTSAATTGAPALPSLLIPQNDGNPREWSLAAIKSATEWERETQGAGRIARAAATDATASITNGTLVAAEILQTNNPHQTITIRWRVRKVTGDNRAGAAPDERVCPICGPQEGLPMEIWARYLSAPPAHHGCRCELQVFVAIILPGLLTGAVEPGPISPPNRPRF